VRESRGMLPCGVSIACTFASLTAAPGSSERAQRVVPTEAGGTAQRDSRAVDSRAQGR